MSLYSDYLAQLEASQPQTTGTGLERDPEIVAKEESMRLSEEEAHQAEAYFHESEKQSAFMDGVDSFNAVMDNIFGLPIRQVAEAMGAGEASAKYHETMQNRAARAEEFSPTASSIGRFTGQMAASLPVAVATSGMGLLKAGALQGGSFMAADPTSFTPEGNISGQSIPNVASGAIGGAIANKLLGVAGDALSSVASGARNLTGKLRGRLVDKAAVQETGDALAQHGFKPTGGLVSGNEAIQTAEAKLAGVPFAGSPIREVFEENVKHVPDAVRDLSKLVASDASGNPIGLTAAAESGLRAAKKEATKLYDKVESMATSTKNLVNISALKEQVGNLVRDVPGGVDGLTKTGKMLADRILKSGDGISFAEARVLRKAINKSVPQIGKSTDATAAEVEGVQGLIPALEGQITEWGNSSGNKQILKALNKANGYYSFYKTAIKDGGLKEFMKDTVAQNNYIRKILSTKNDALITQQSQLLGSNFTKEVQANAIQKILKDATNKEGVVNMTNLAYALENNPVLKSTLATPEMKATLGLARALRAISAHPISKGQMPDKTLMYTAGATAAYFQPVTALFGIIGGRGLAKATTSPNIQKTLINLGKMPPNTNPKFYENVLKKLSPVLKQGAVGVAVNTSRD